METHKQDDSAYGKYVIQFRNKKKNTTSAIKKDTPNNRQKKFQELYFKTKQNFHDYETSKGYTL